MTYPNPAVEVSRRLFLIGGIVAATWLAWLTDFRPHVMVSLPEALTTPPSPGGSGASLRTL